MLLRIFDPRALILAVNAAVASSALAEVSVVRMGPNVGVPMGDPFQPHGGVSRVLERLAVDMKQFVTGFDSCADLVAGPLERGTPRDSLRDTWTVIQKLSVECWAVLQLDPETPVEAATSDDRISPELVQGIMAKAAELSASSEEWDKTLMDFSGGEIQCADGLRCRLSRPDGQNPPEQSLEFEMILASGDSQFIKVTQMVYGRSGFVYGVEWQSTDTGGKVAAIFPDLH